MLSWYVSIQGFIVRELTTSGNGLYMALVLWQQPEYYYYKTSGKKSLIKNERGIGMALSTKKEETRGHYTAIRRT